MGEMSSEPHGRSAAENGRARSAAWVDAAGVPAGHTARVLTAIIGEGLRIRRRPAAPSAEQRASRSVYRDDVDGLAAASVRRHHSASSARIALTH